jgi:hypothetical protein
VDCEADDGGDDRHKGGVEGQIAVGYNCSAVVAACSSISP